MKGWIKAVVTKGRLKGTQIDIKIEPTGAESEVLINGKPPKDLLVRAVHIHLRANDVTKVVLETNINPITVKNHTTGAKA